MYDIRCKSQNQLFVRFVQCSLLIGVMVFTSAAWAQNYQADYDKASAWLASTSQPTVTLQDHAIVDEANSSRINPYFANQGVMGFTKNSSYYANAENWMEWYWAHVSWPRTFTYNNQQINVYGAINDFNVGSGGAETAVPDPDSQGFLHPDSTDAYAGTFLSLAYQLYQTGDPGAQAYIRGIVFPAPPNSDRLDYVGEVVLATKQSGGNNLTWARPDYNIEYLMDNSEAYRGLSDLVALYNALGQSSKASFYSPHASQMLTGIQNSLWNSGANDYYWYTTDTGASGTVSWGTWYPDSVSQVFPIALGVIAPTDSRAIAIWNTFQSNWRTKWTTLATGDSYPWVIVAYAAALMGDTGDVNTFITNMEMTYVSNNFVGSAGHSWSVNEAGWFIRLNARMLGK
jgi:hypothetical protein